MVLEFKTYQLKKESYQYNTLVIDGAPNEFIIVGEQSFDKGRLECYKVHQLEKDGGLKLIAGIELDVLAYTIPKADLELKSVDIGYETVEIDIPKEYLTMDIIENIQRLNE